MHPHVQLSLNILLSLSIYKYQVIITYFKYFLKIFVQFTKMYIKFGIYSFYREYLKSHKIKDHNILVAIYEK